MQSLVTPIGYLAESCGYCKDPSSRQCTPDSRACYYMRSKSMTVDVYQELVDRGHRRSGTLFYKPDVLRHCCPHYTVRLPAASFEPVKEQRHAVNKWNKFVLGEDYIKEAARLYPKSKEDKARERQSFDLVTVIHGSEYETLKRPPEPAHRFEVTIEPDEFTLEKYRLFENYQMNVHHDKAEEVSQGAFRSFLCDSPLQRTTKTFDGKPQRLGSYHQCYRLDGRLIAMGVVDLLPHCVSGVYFIYHSDFEKWSFGKLSAMREAALALEEGYKYYYMGYYIHSCVKMRYKGDYKPQYVLDPETYDWNPLEGELRALLDLKPYVSLSRERRRNAEEKSESEGHAEGEQGEGPAGPENADEFPLPEAADAGAAVRSGLSLFDLGVPGLMTPEELSRFEGFDHIRVNVGPGLTMKTKEFRSWDRDDIKDPNTVKGIIGELVACVGPSVAEKITVQLHGQ